MSEVKQVLYDLRTTYNGPFLVEDFYSGVDKWISDNGFEKETKKKAEFVTKSGKKIEWHIEIHTKLDELNQSAIVLRALFNNVKEIVIKRSGKKIKINNGDAFISIDGFLKSQIRASFWQIKPIYTFFRTLSDRFIYNYWSDKWDGTVAGGCNDLFKFVTRFFREAKEKYK